MATPEIPPEALAAAVEAEIRRRRSVKAAQRAKRRKPAPGTGGRRRYRPQSSPDDRQYVPGALDHWRKVHRLSQRQAQAAIGYSATSSSWKNWESGHVAPAYGTLLRIIAATGLGYLRPTSDPRGVSDVAPELLLEATRVAHQRAVRARRARRKARRDVP